MVTAFLESLKFGKYVSVPLLHIWRMLSVEMVILLIVICVVCCGNVN